MDVYQILNNNNIKAAFECKVLIDIKIPGI